jgi:phosphatidylethanolamine-binding protein (PEBP) family uncharacterized protein
MSADGANVSFDDRKSESHEHLPRATQRLGLGARYAGARRCSFADKTFAASMGSADLVLAHYHFRLLALSTAQLRAKANASCRENEREARKSQLAEAILVGWYER